jgi:hypothetical protein
MLNKGGYQLSWPCACVMCGVQSREVMSELLAALLASCDNLPRSAQAEAMKQR